MISDTTLALICVAGLAPLIGVAAGDALRELVPPRGELLSRLALLRLPDMLRRRGLAVEPYLRAVPRRQLTAQMRACETCPSKSRCDAVLRSASGVDFAFCPSNTAISALRGRLLPSA